MQQVITAEQARKITGKQDGPLTLPQYEKACELLQECTTILEAKKWVDAASAYETIAKIKHDQRALRLSKALLYQAALACRALAEEEAKRRNLGRSGLAPVNVVLKENGFSNGEAQGTGVLKKIAERGGIAELLARPTPPSLVRIGHNADGARPVSSGIWLLASACEGTSPQKYVENMREGSGPRSLAKLEFLSEWIADALLLLRQRYSGKP